MPVIGKHYDVSLAWFLVFLRVQFSGPNGFNGGLQSLPLGAFLRASPFPSFFA